MTKVIVVENLRLPQVSYNIYLEHTCRRQKVGVLGMFGELMRSGTDSSTKAELDEAVDFIGGSLYASSSNLGGRSLTKHSSELLSLMTDVLLALHS